MRLASLTPSARPRGNQSPAQLAAGTWSQRFSVFSLTAIIQPISYELSPPLPWHPRLEQNFNTCSERNGLKPPLPHLMKLERTEHSLCYAGLPGHVGRISERFRGSPAKTQQDHGGRRRRECGAAAPGAGEPWRVHHSITHAACNRNKQPHRMDGRGRSEVQPESTGEQVRRQRQNEPKGAAQLATQNWGVGVGGDLEDRAKRPEDDPWGRPGERGGSGGRGCSLSASDPTIITIAHYYYFRGKIIVQHQAVLHIVQMTRGSARFISF